MTIVHRVFMGLGVCAVIMGILLAVFGNMLGVWIALAGGYGIYSSYKSIKKIANERERPQPRDKEGGKR
jgi:hypothetical protein